METAHTLRFTTLGHPMRLDIFRLLVRRYPDQMPAGEIAQALDLKSSTLSSYLNALHQTGLIDQHRDGTSLKYSANIDNIRATIDYLVLDCCRSRTTVCVNASPSPQKFNVLFICTGNSARSIMAEALLNSIAPDRFCAYSAGTLPYQNPNPFALEVLRVNGHDVQALRSKSISEFTSSDAPKFDFVFTVCDQAANEDCPAWPNTPITGHWGIPDPVQTKGGKASEMLAFHQTYGALHNRIAAFAALPLNNLDRISQQNAVDVIGTQK